MPALSLWPNTGRLVVILSSEGLAYNFASHGGWEPLAAGGMPTHDQTSPILYPVAAGVLAGNGFWTPPPDFNPPSGACAVCVLAANAAGAPTQQVDQWPPAWLDWVAHPGGARGGWSL